MATCKDRTVFSAVVDCSAPFGVNPGDICLYLEKGLVTENAVEKLPAVLACLETDPRVDLYWGAGEDMIATDFYHNIVKVDEKRHTFAEVNQRSVIDPTKFLLYAEKALHRRYGLSADDIIRRYRDYAEGRRVKRLKEFIIDYLGIDYKPSNIVYVSTILLFYGLRKKRGRKKVKPVAEKRKIVVTEYKRGLSPTEIARKHGIGVGTVYSILEEEGLYRRGQRKKKPTRMVTEDVVREFCAIHDVVGKGSFAAAVAGVGYGYTTKLKKYCDGKVTKKKVIRAVALMKLAGIRNDKILSAISKALDKLSRKDAETVMKAVLSTHVRPSEKRRCWYVLVMRTIPGYKEKPMKEFADKIGVSEAAVRKCLSQFR